jgi:hypothetical protein
MLFLAVALLATPAFAQLALTDNCTGQPTGTGSDMGPIDIPAGLLGLTDDLTMTGTGCTNLTGFDSVVCFRVEASCSAGFTFTPLATAFGNFNIVVQPGTESCENTPQECVESGTSGDVGDSVQLGFVDIAAGSLVCLYTASTVQGFQSLTSTVDLVTCGALPVEVQSFTVESSEEAAPAPR